MAKAIKPFDTSKKPTKVWPILLPVEWIGTAFLTIGYKVNKINCENLEAPYLVLCNHSAFVDFPMAVKGMFPHKSSWVISVEEFVGREWLMRAIGGIYKRKFTSDLKVVKHILYALTRQKVCCTIYPEARFSLIGINEQIDGALGKLAKTAKCPVVTFIQHGNFLQSPQWNKHPYRKVPIEGEFKQIVTKEEVMTLSADEIQARIEAEFHYDDYAWQKENNIKIKSKKRAHNLHKVLYQCPVCGKEFCTDSKDTKIWCNECGASWEMNELGELIRENGENVFTHVPDWYNWERENVRREVREGRYKFEDEARLEIMANAVVGFKKLGNVRLTHDYNGFTMEGVLDDGTEFKFNRSVASMRSLHIEYNFKKKGVTTPSDGIDLATDKETYFAYPNTAHNVLTKLHFATEELHLAELESKKQKIEA